MDFKPLVTFYIISFNRPGLLRRAIDSVLAQDYVNIEVIVVDDASSKDTISVLNEYTKFTNFRFFVNKKNMGACWSRNVAIKHARGEFITGLDDDDYVQPERVSCFLRHYHDRYSFLCSCYNNTKRIGREMEIKASYLLFDNIAGNQFFARTSRVRDILFDESLPSAQDLDFLYRLSKRYGNFLKLPQPTYFLDQSSEDRISTSPRKINGLVQFYQKHQADMTIAQHVYWRFLIRKWSSRSKIYKHFLNLLMLITNPRKLYLR